MRKSRDKEDPMIHRGRWGRWRVRFFDPLTGKLKEKSCKTKSDAELLRRAISRGDDLNLWFPQKENLQSVKNFGDLAEKWLDHGLHIRRLSISCLSNYRSHLRNHILPVLGTILLSDLSIHHIEELSKVIRIKRPKTNSYTALKKNRWQESTDELSLSYQKEILTVACMIATWGSKRKPAYLRENPFEDFKLPSCPEHAYSYWSLDDEDKFLYWLESGAYYEKLTTRYRKAGKSQYKMQLQLRDHQELLDIVLIALRTGMRMGEIGALQNQDVDLVSGFILVRRTWSQKEKKIKNTTKGKKIRRIEINDDVRNILEKRLDFPQNKPLFNIHMNNIKFFSRTCRWANVKEIHFHSLRHTCLTNLANGYGMGKPLALPKVQQIAGHADIKTTMRYVHNDVIKDTASLQWSRKERLEMKRSFASAQDDVEVNIFKDGLRLITNNSSCKNLPK